MSILNMPRTRTIHIHPRKVMLRPTEPQVFVPPNKRFIESRPESTLKRVWFALRRHKWQLLLLPLLGLAVGLAITLATPTTYRATVQLQITPEDGSTEKPLFLANHYELLKSRLLARKVIDALGATAGPVDAQTPDRTWLTQLSDKVAWLLVGEKLSPAPKLGELPEEERFLAGVTIEPVPDSTLIKVHYDSHEPAKAERTANEIANQFMLLGQSPDATTTDQVKTLITEQISAAQSALEKSETALAQYAQEHEITAVNGTPDPAADRLAQLETAVTDAEKARIDAESLYEQSRKGETIQFLTDNPVIRPLQENYTKQQADYQEKLKFYKPDYPEMLTLQEQINVTKKQLDEGLKTARDEAKAKYLTAQQKEITLRKELAQQKDKLLDIRSKTVSYNALAREVETNRSIYDGLLQNIKDINSTTSLNEEKVTVIDPAILPYSRFSPNINLNLAVGTVLGLLFGIVIAFLREHFDDRIKGRDALENLLNIPVLGCIPQDKAGKNHNFLPTTPSNSVEAYRSLRANLMFSINLETNPVIHVTSAGVNEGKTDVCLNMAIALAQAGKKILLVDGNLRKPSLHQKLEIDNSAGLSDFLNGQSNLKSLIQTTQIPNVYVLPAGSIVSDPAELLLDHQMNELLELAPREFDMIILDSPAVLDMADALVLSHWASLTLLVAAHSKSRKKSVVDALHRLRHAQSIVVGAVLTKSKEMTINHYHSYKKIKRSH